MKCRICGCSFKVDEAREDYYDEFHGDPDYDDQYPEHDVCGDCAITDTDSNISAGIDAITGGQDVEITWLD